MAENNNRRRNIVIAIVIIALLIVAALLLWLLLLRRPTTTPPAGTTPSTNQPPSTLPSTNTPATNSAVNQPVNTNSAVPPAKPDATSTLRTLAKSFAERLGSFSNTSSFENIEDLKAFMTPAMTQWANNFLIQARASQPTAAGYSGTTTRAISVSVTKLDETAGRAEITVKTQRHEVAGNSDNVYYQDLNLVFLKQGDTWKVDSAVWGQKSATGA